MVRLLPLLLWLLSVPAYCQFTIGGNAIDNNCDCFKLTVPFPQQVGSVWHNEPINLNQDFDLKFNLFFGCNDLGADGLVFALQPYGPLGGVIGAGLGMEGISPSLGIYFDTHQNENLGDPAEDHVSLHRHGVVYHNSGHQLTTPVSLANIEDCNWHAFHVKWNFNSLSLKAWLDDELVIDYNGDIILQAFWGINQVYWGFSASTGNAFNLHQVCYLSDIKFDFETASFENCPNTPITFFDETDAYFQNVAWNWDFGDGTSGTGLNAVHSFAEIGNYLVTLTTTDNLGCEHTGTKLIEIKHPDLNAQAHPSSLCDGMTATLVPYLDVLYPMNYEWFSNQNIDYPNEPVTTVTPTSSDYYILHAWDSIHPGYCHAVDTLFVPVIPYPEIGNGGNFVICSNDGPTNLAQLSDADGGGVWMPPLAYLTDVFYPHIDSSGVYGYAFPQCQTDTVYLTIDLFQSPNADIIPTGDICIASEPVQLQAVTPGGFWSGPGIINSETGYFDPQLAGMGQHSVYYQFEGDCPTIGHTFVPVYSEIANLLISQNRFCINEEETILLSLPVEANWWGAGIIDEINGIFDPSIAGLGVHQIMVAYETTCDDSLSFSLEVLPLPQATVNWPAGIGCSPVSAEFGMMSPNELASCLWSFGDGSPNGYDCNVLDHNYFNEGSYNPELTITDINGCINTFQSSQPIEVLETPVARFELEPQVSGTTSNQVNFSNLSENAHFYYWNFGDGLGSEMINPIHHFDPAQSIYEVCLQAVNANGCSNEFCVSHNFGGSTLYFAPNAFTPNGDGINDVFQLKISETANFELSIFNRQGMRVFYTTNGAGGWDGGSEPSEVYIWVATAVGAERLTLDGFVNLIR